MTSSYLFGDRSVSRFARSTPEWCAGSSQPMSRIRLIFGTAVWEKQNVEVFKRAGVSVFKARKMIVIVDYRHLMPNGLATAPCPVLISVIFRPAEHVSLPHWRARSEFRSDKAQGWSSTSTNSRSGPSRDLAVVVEPLRTRSRTTFVAWSLWLHRNSRRASRAEGRLDENDEISLRRSSVRARDYRAAGRVPVGPN